MPVNSNQYLQGINQTTGTGVPSHSAVAGDRYTDTATGLTYQYTTSWQTVSYGSSSVNIYNTDGTLTADRTVSGNSKILTFDAVRREVHNVIPNLNDATGFIINIESGNFDPIATSRLFKIYDSTNLSERFGISVSGHAIFNNTYRLPITDGFIGQVLKTNGLGDVTWGTAGGLTYFTEAQNTSSPNVLTYVDSLTAVSTTTNADFAILPKGNGAFLVGHVPDGSIANGGKRGTFAIDIQPASLNYASGALGVGAITIGTENGATANYATSIGTGGIASGVGSLWLGGNLGGVGVASGANSVAIQLQSRATNTGSVAFSNAISSGLYSFAASYGTASGNHSVAMAGATYGGSIASGTCCVAFGEYSKASGSNSMAILTNADTFSHKSRLSYGSQITTAAGSPVSNVQGSVQGSTLSVGIETNNATPTTLGNYGGTAIPLILQNNNSVRVKGTIIGRQTASTNTSAWDFDVLIQRGTSAATTTLLISNINVVQNTPAWGTPTLTADTTNGGLDIKVIGAASTSIRWTCVFTTTEVVYA